VTCSAIKNQGIVDIWKLIKDYKEATTKTGYFETHRNEQNKFWLMQTIKERLKSDFFNNQIIKKELQNQLELIEANKTTPFAAADYLLNL